MQRMMMMMATTGGRKQAIWNVSHLAIFTVSIKHRSEALAWVRVALTSPLWQLLLLDNGEPKLAKSFYLIITISLTRAFPYYHRTGRWERPARAAHCGGGDWQSLSSSDGAEHYSSWRSVGALTRGPLPVNPVRICSKISVWIVFKIENKFSSIFCLENDR